MIGVINYLMMMRFPRFFVLCGSVILFASGCVSTATTSAYRQTNRMEDIELLNEKIRRLHGDVESISMQMDRLRDDIELLQADRTAAAQTYAASLQSALSTIEDQIRDVDSKRIADRLEIVDIVSQKVTEIVNAHPARTPVPSGNGSPTDFGYEHIVEEGENLSRIAQAYNTTVNAIAEANNISRTDILKLGQKLFIPE